MVADVCPDAAELQMEWGARCSGPRLPKGVDGIVMLWGFFTVGAWRSSRERSIRERFIL